MPNREKGTYPTETAPALVRSALALLATFVMPVARAGERFGPREEAQLLANAGEALYERASLRSERRLVEFLEAARFLEEAQRLDPANLKALAFLGLAWLEAARSDAKWLDPAFESLARFFRLAGGPGSGRLLARVRARLDELCTQGLPAGAAEWWAAWRERVVAAEGSAAYGGELLELVEKMRSSLDALEREWAVEGLTERLASFGETAGTGSSSATLVILSSLEEVLRKDRSERVRAAAARSLGALAPAGREATLAEALRNDPSARVRAACAEALAGRREPSAEAVAALLSALQQDTPLVASSAARALGTLGGHYDALVRALESGSPLVREAAAEALAHGRLAKSDDTRTKELTTALIGLLSDHRAPVRAAAALALSGKLRATSLPERLIELLKDPDRDVRYRAALAASNHLTISPQDPGELYQRARTGLRALLSDEDPKVRFAAARHLFLAERDGQAHKELERLLGCGVPVGPKADGHSFTTLGEEAQKVLKSVERAGGGE